jgi:hypothetical protein
MRPWITAMSLAAAAALPLALAPASASASCSDAKTTGTILGGVGGALIGNSIARGGGGAIVGGVGGALLGRSIASSSCRHARYAYGPARYGYPPPLAAAPVYYNDYGDPVTPPPPAGAPVADAAPADRYCHVETRAFYDDQGQLVRAPVRVCPR